MNTQETYNFKRTGHNSYAFTTDYNIIYNVSFVEGSFYFPPFPDHFSVFEFSINVLSLGDNLSAPLDIKTETTIVKILNAFLSNKENCAIYICQNLDNRHYARKRKFDTWFKQAQNESIEKYDMTVEYDDFIYLTSLIIRKDNPHKTEIVEIFLDFDNQIGHK